MIRPPTRDEPYPGRLPPVRQQWRRLAPTLRLLTVGIPIVFLAVIALFSPLAAATIAILVVGLAAATVVYVKNRTDRHNAAIDRGEITVVDDPDFRPEPAHDLPEAVVRRLARYGFDAGDIGRVLRWDAGWIVGRSNPRDVAAVVGDDGGLAQFDPRTTSDLWAVREYRAGRGREE